MTDSGYLRRAMGQTFALLRERSWERQRAMIVAHVGDLVDATAVRVREPDSTGCWRCSDAGGVLDIPAVGRQMEDALLTRALAEGHSLLSNHPRLDVELRPLAQRCQARGLTVQVMLARNDDENQAAFAIHWVGRERPEHGRRVALMYYWDTARLAVGIARERERIEDELTAMRGRAYRDARTGLPNMLALEEQFGRYEHTAPLSVVGLDFDGLREANNTLGYDGGDELIECVGHAILRLAEVGEFAVRVNTAGDEFVVLLPGATDETACRRAREIEAALDVLEVPGRLRGIYRGASVAHATRRQGESPHEMLKRAMTTMHERKRERAAQRGRPTPGDRQTVQ